MQKSKRWDTRGRLVACCSGFWFVFTFQELDFYFFPPSAFSSKHCYKSLFIFPSSDNTLLPLAYLH